MVEDAALEDELDALLSDDPSEFVENRCKESLLSFASGRGYVATRDVYNRRGVLLARAGQGIDARRKELLLNHRLKDRFLNCVGLENEVELHAIPESVTVLTKKYLAGAAADFVPTLSATNEMLEEINFSTAVRTSMTALSERHRGAYEASYLCAILVTRMAKDMAYPKHMVLEAFTTALFHHLGYSNLEESESDSAFATLHPNVEQQKIIKVHPLWTFKLLESANQISEDDADVFRFSAASLQGVLLHHRGVDGVSGYGGVGPPNEIGRLLYVADTFIALAETGLTSPDALRLMERHAAQTGNAVKADATHFSAQRGPQPVGNLFDAQYLALLQSFLTADVAIPVKAGLRRAERLSTDFLDALFLALNRIARELGEVRNSMTRYVQDPEVVAVGRVELEDLSGQCAVMLKSVLTESQLFTRTTDQLHELAQADQVGTLITNMHPVFRQLRDGIATVRSALTQLLEHGQEDAPDATLAAFHVTVASIEKMLSEAYQEYLDATQTRALDAIA